MSRIELFAHKSKRVNTILNQLTSDFQPAVKNVAQAGHNLLRSYQNFNRNHYLYTASLYALAFSSSTAEQDVRECTKQLERITEAMKTIYAGQTEWMDHFTDMINTITGNCEGEKERLKALKDGFIKREKKLNKAVNSGKKMPSELENFYDSELNLANDHQSQRYRFFVEKHFKLLKLYADWTGSSSSLLEKEFNFGIKVHDEKYINNNTQIPKASVKNQAKEHSINNIILQQQSEPKEKISIIQERNGQHHKRGNSTAYSQKQLHEERRLSVLEENESNARQEDMQHSSINLQKGSHQGLFRPIPVLPRSQQKFRHSLVETYPNQMIINDLIQWDERVSKDENHQQRNFQFSGKEAQQLQKYYSDGPSTNGDFDSIKRELHGFNKSGFSPQLSNNSSQEISNQNIRPFVSSITIKNQFPSQLDKSTLVSRNGRGLPFSHIRAQSAESMNSTIARLTPPIFSSSDYNRLLECITPYEAQDDNKSTQLSLGLGERIVLLKSGTRGWVLGRSEDGSKQGWFPAKYLKLV